MPSAYSKSRQPNSRAKLRKSVPPRQASAPASGRTRALLLGVVLIVATVVLYYPATSHPFGIYDDDLYVTGNAHVKAGLQWATIRWAATSFDAANWHPVTWLSHALDCQLFDLDASGHHATNLLFHVLNALLLYGVLWRATGSSGRSFAVAALFAVHPINVESVAWVAERKNLLSIFFFLLALGAYRWYARRPRIGPYALVASLYALGLMAKPQVITFPFVLLLWDYWPLERVAFRHSPFAVRQNAGASIVGEQQRAGSKDRVSSGEWRLLLEKLPLFALSAASAVITIKAQRASGAIRWFPFSVRLENAVVAYARYLGKALWPSRLAVIYPHPEHTLPTWPVVASSILLVVITALVIWQRQRRYLLVGWFWFLGTLVPMIGLVQVGGQAMADRYAYLSFIGLFVMIGWGVSEWALAQRITGRWLAGATAAVLLALAAVAHHQLEYWQDNVSLWSHTLQITQNNWLAENNMGAALLGEGRPDDAIAHFRASAAIYPNDPVSHLDIGYYEQQQRNYVVAFAEYDKVLKVAPPVEKNIVAEAHNNMGFAYLHLREPDKARQNFQAAVQFNPQHSRAWIGLGVTAQKAADLNSAIQDYTRSTQAEPSDLAYLLLAQALALRGDSAQAQIATQQARALSPNFEHTQRVVQGLLASQ